MTEPKYDDSGQLEARADEFAPQEDLLRDFLDNYEFGDAVDARIRAVLDVARAEPGASVAGQLGVPADGQWYEVRAHMKRLPGGGELHDSVAVYLASPSSNTRPGLPRDALYRRIHAIPTLAHYGKGEQCFPITDAVLAALAASPSSVWADDLIAWAESVNRMDEDDFRHDVEGQLLDLRRIMVRREKR